MQDKQYARGVTPTAEVRRARRQLVDMVAASRVRDRLLPSHADMHELNAETVCTCTRMMGS